MSFELARVTSKGQITIPKAIRDKLKLKEGDKVLFIESKDGKITIENAGLIALNRISDEVAPEIKKMNIAEDDVKQWFEEVRDELWKEIKEK
jgi:AbrB family looped-hinge helix DNA binding protein